MPSKLTARRQFLYQGAGLLLPIQGWTMPSSKKFTHLVAKIFDVHAKQFQSVDSAQSSFEEMRDIGITDVMMLETLYQTPAIQTCLPLTGLKIWVISQMFFNDSLEKAELKDQWAITELGELAFEKSEAGAWLRMLCPNGGSNPHSKNSFIQQRREDIKYIVKHATPDGISLDFTRYFSYWEGITQANHKKGLIDTCFCSHCLDLFQRQTKIQLPKLSSVRQKSLWIHKYHQALWTQFKLNSITNFVHELITGIRKDHPRIQFSLHSVPWLSGEYESARERIVAQDLAALAKDLTWISPMCYTKLLNKPAAWISQVVNDVAQTTRLHPTLNIIPAIEVDCSIQELEASLTAIANSQARGVAFWPWEKMTKQQKYAVHAFQSKSLP